MKHLFYKNTVSIMRISSETQTNSTDELQHLQARKRGSSSRPVRFKSSVTNPCLGICALAQSWKQNRWMCFLFLVSLSPHISALILTRPSSLRCALRVSSYLQPGGEREWKVDRENISALSAIFFHKWLRETAENQWGSAVHSQSHGRGRTQPWAEVSLSAAPQMPPWPQAFNQTRLLSTIKFAVNHPHKQSGSGCQVRNYLYSQRTTRRK